MMHNVLSLTLDPYYGSDIQAAISDAVQIRRMLSLGYVRFYYWRSQSEWSVFECYSDHAIETTSDPPKQYH